MLKKAPTLSDVKKSIFRTKQQVLVKMGKSEQTVDMDYKVEREKFDEREKNLKDLQKSLLRYDKALRELTTAHNEIYTKFQVLFDPSTPLYNTAQNSGRISNDIDVARQAFEEINRERVQKPLHDFLLLFRTMERRCVERSRRLTDMDRYNQDYQNFVTKEHKGDADPTKLNQLKEKADIMTASYHALNQEIMEDFGHMDYNRNHVVDGIFASFVDSQTIYFKKTLDGVQSLERDLQEVDRNLAANVSHMITSDEDSASRKPPEALAAEGVHYQATHTTTNPPPSNPYYAPTGAHQAAATGQAPIPTSSTTTTTTSTSSSTPTTTNAPPQFQPQGLGGPPSYVEQSIPPFEPSSHSQAPPIPAAPAPSSLPPAQQKCRGLYPFAGLEAGELPFQPNDVMTILNQFGDWWEAELRGRRGIIPSNYVELV